MHERRVFLRRSLQLGAAGLYAGWAVTGCSTQPLTPHDVAPPADVAPGPSALQNPTPVDATAPPVPLPDLFDASLLDADFWVKPRTLTMWRPASGERLSLLYWKDGAMRPGAYERICHVLRDVQAKRTHPMDPKLIETLWACEAFCARYGITRPLEILSGFRTPATNKRLIEAGLPAARKSLHLDGRAADVRIVDLNTEILGGLVRSFERGGVGFYFRPGTTGGWIHTDTGVNRTWRG